MVGFVVLFGWLVFRLLTLEGGLRLLWFDVAEVDLCCLWILYCLGLFVCFDSACIDLGVIYLRGDYGLF